MNEEHAELCSSPEWGTYLATGLIPPVLEGVDLRRDLLEVGPGYGLATDVLHQLVGRLIAIEIDLELSASLARRFQGTNVTIVTGDAAESPFGQGTFDSAASFTMLHHVPSRELQDQLLREVARVLRPGGVFIGSDSRDSEAFREFHIDDVCVPVDPSRLQERLKEAGFRSTKVSVTDEATLFVAYLSD